MPKFNATPKHAAPPGAPKMSADLLSRAALFSFGTHQWGGHAKADKTKIDTQAEKRMLSVGKRLLECVEFKAIAQYQREVKQWCKDRSMPSFLRKGMYVVSLDLVHDYEAKLASAQAHIAHTLVPAFLAVYPAKREEARALLGDLFDLKDYPGELDMARRFGIDWQWVYFGVPDNLPEGVRKREAEKLRKSFDDAQQQITAALRANFAELVRSATEKLAVKPGEKAPVIKDAALEKLHGFFETFRGRNLMEDGELEVCVNELEALLRGVSGEQIRDDEALRARLAEEFARINATVGELVEKIPVRKFALED